MAGDPLKWLWSRIARALLRAAGYGSPLDYYALYLCEVVSQSADKAKVDVRPINAPHVPSLSAVPLLLGYPGTKTTLAAGDKVLVGFLGGSPAGRYAIGFQVGGPDPADIVIVGGTKGVARGDDTLTSSTQAGAWAGVVEAAINALAPGSFTPGNAWATTVGIPGGLGKINAASVSTKVKVG